MSNGPLRGKQSDNINHDTEQDQGAVMESIKSPTKKRQRHQSKCAVRPRHTCTTLRLLLSTLALLAVCVRTTVAAGGSKWLENRLPRIADAHIDEATIPIESSIPLGDDSDATQSTSSSPLLVVATHEGQVWTIDSTDGSLVAGFSTGPPLLVVDDQYEEATMDGAEFPAIPEGLAQSQIVPSMDGVLYYRQPNNDNHHSKLVPIASIRDLVDNPIQMCHEVEGGNCDILTATSLGPSLFSLNSQGSLNWARARTSSTTARAKPVPMQRKPSESSIESGDDHDDSSSTDNDESTVNSSTSKTNLLLQRQDYLVQQISTETGEQVWNITWGNLAFLDFVGDDESEGGATRRRRRSSSDQSFHFLPSDEPVESDLPSLIFANQGRSLVALWSQPPKFLWKRDFISVITNVFGIENNAWQSVNIVAEQDGLDDESELGGSKRQGSSRRILQPLLPDHEETEAEKEAHKFWWWAGGSRGLGKENHYHLEQFFVHPHEENGLIFVPRPHAHKLVRNSWFLNHLWDSPQARGQQSFQGFIASEAHNKIREADSEDKSQDDDKSSSTSQTENYPVPHIHIDTRMPRLLLLPPSEPPLPSPVPSGGLFLSWPVVIGIVTLLVGTAGAAFVVYDQKKQKWMARHYEGAAENSVSSGPNHSVADLSSNTVSASLTRTRSQSITIAAERSQSHSKQSSLAGGDSNHGISKPNPRRHTLNRSCSAPLMTSDAISTFQDEIAQTNLDDQTNHGIDFSSSNKLPIPAPEEAPSPADVKKGQLIKYQSAPVGVATATPQGVGMIDGIPLIRYSRYQSEFREIEPLGRGGFGSVFRVANVLDGREYAVKKVSIRSSDWSSPGTEAFSQELHRVLREVKFLALLDHPNIVRYYTAWLEMEENEQLPSGEETNANTNTFSRRFSSELLTGMDTSLGDNGRSNTSSVFPSKASASTSKATLSHLKPSKNANPLGWNNPLVNFEDSSVSAFRPRHPMPVVPDTEDCGFIFEERSDDGQGEEDPSFAAGNYASSYGGHSVTSSEYSKSEHSHSASSSWDASYSLNRRNKAAASNDKRDDKEDKDKESSGAGADRRKNGKTSRHTLYIQMQLCSPETLSDFLSNMEARRGPTHVQSGGSETAVDIPLALRLFLQIVQAVHHVHQQSLIHRDLKPSNCFIDETGTVKVGDFGLSRESNDGSETKPNSSLILDGQPDVQGTGDNTVGVGTRSYASPEQMNGSDYDAKTDIYALGVMLFELLWPMSTGMERHINFQNLRSEDCTFPDGWGASVCECFPSLDDLVRSMLSRKPNDRPNADKVARHIQGLIEEHSVTLNINRHDSDNDNIVCVRVEAKPVPDVLKLTMDLIREAAAPETLEIVQYGMRSGTKKTTSNDEEPQKRAILEFALAFSSCNDAHCHSKGSALVDKLQDHEVILVARHVWHQATLANWGSHSSR